MRKNTERTLRALLVGTGLCMMVGFAGWRAEANHPKRNVVEETDQERVIDKAAVLDKVTYDAAPPKLAIKYQPTYTEDELLLMRIASCEAGNQGIEGMAYVIKVVQNRVEDEHFPDSVRGVIYEKYQFAAIDSSYWQSGYLADGATKALSLVNSGWDESEGAIAFCTRAADQWHMEHLNYLFSYKDHEFYGFK